MAGKSRKPWLWCPGPGHGFFVGDFAGACGRFCLTLSFVAPDPERSSGVRCEMSYRSRLTGIAQFGIFRPWRVRETGSLNPVWEQSLQVCRRLVIADRLAPSRIWMWKTAKADCYCYNTSGSPDRWSSASPVAAAHADREVGRDIVARTGLELRARCPTP